MRKDSQLLHRRLHHSQYPCNTIAGQYNDICIGRTDLSTYHVYIYVTVESRRECIVLLSEFLFFPLHAVRAQKNSFFDSLSTRYVPRVATLRIHDLILFPSRLDKWSVILAKSRTLFVDRPCIAKVHARSQDHGSPCVSPDDPPIVSLHLHMKIAKRSFYVLGIFLDVFRFLHR